MMRLRSRQDPAATAERRYRPVPLDSIASPMAVAATIGEDDRFWEHGGLDYLAILRALSYRRAHLEWSSPRDRAELRRALGRAWSRRDELRGASTITQQLAKNLYLSPSRNPLRKVKEAVTAYRLEAALGKRRILELYLNVAELGEEVWGVEAASQAYFDRPARRLTRSQAAALAGALPFPLRSNPGYHPGRMRWRQNLILRRMGGEAIVVPRALPEDAPLPDTIIPALPDTVLEVRPVPIDTLLPPAPLPDSVQ
jgi:monofunctional biosynthetic peptidoglycan transglycosylase